MSNGIRHGHPEVSRNDKWEHDKYVWPSGLELFIYDDGRVKIGSWNASVAVEMVHNYGPGRTERPNAWVEARFAERLS
jgi:hypothetical protein